MESMTVAVTGASGFVGSHIVRELVAKGHKVKALVRDHAKGRGLVAGGAAGKVELVQGDVFEPASLAKLMAGCNAVVHAVGILREERGGRTFQRMHVQATKAVLDAAKAAGVKRYVQISALNVSPTGVAEYLTSKFEAERLVQTSGLGWTILRPGMIVGEGSKFLEMVKGWAKNEQAPFIFMPYFTGQREDHSVPMGPVHPTTPMVQPVAVEDVAAAVMTSLANANSVGETYNLVGPDMVSWPEFLKWARDRVAPHSSVQPFGLPGEPQAVVADIAALVGMKHVLPFDSGMARMGSRDSVAELVKTREHLGLATRRVIGAAS